MEQRLNRTTVCRVVVIVERTSCIAQVRLRMVRSCVQTSGGYIAFVFGKFPKHDPRLLCFRGDM